MWIKSDVEEIVFNLQQMTIVMRPSSWHQNFGPNGLSTPAQGLCLNFFSSITADFNISSALRWAIIIIISIIIIWTEDSQGELSVKQWSVRHACPSSTLSNSNIS